MIYSDKFAYTPKIKNLEEYETVNEGNQYTDCLVAFIHAEEQDEKEEFNAFEKKMVKNLKWAAGKNNTNRIILHSFAHLSDSKASPEFTKNIFDKAQERLENANYQVFQTPFGYFLDLNLNAPGYSLARIFKSL